MMRALFAETETSNPGDFSEEETRDLFSPIFFDKGDEFLIPPETCLHHFQQLRSRVQRL